MTRKDFIARLGLGAAFALTASCLGSCSKESTGPSADDVDFTINLDDPSFSRLQENGSYIIHQRTVVAKTLDGVFVAATVVCSHEDYEQITWQGEEWFCTKHFARFDREGQGLNANGRKGLTTFQTYLEGTNLRIFS